MISHSLPDNSIIAADAVFANADFEKYLPFTVAHDYLYGPSGGALGQGIPLALGAAIACPNRKVINIQDDVSAMYSFQGLWTMAREKADVITILLNSNKKFQSSEGESRRVYGSQQEPGSRAISQLENPTLDFCKLSSGLGVPATRVQSNAQFLDIFCQTLSTKGPHLINAEL